MTFTQSSGEPSFVESARVSVARASPAPPFPAAMERESIRITLPYRFQVFEGGKDDGKAGGEHTLTPGAPSNMPDKSPANRELSVRDAVGGGAELRGQRVRLTSCTIVEANPDDLQCQEGTGGEDAAIVLIDGATLDRTDARRAFVHCKDDTPHPRCHAQVSGTVHVDEEGEAQIKDARIDWRNPAELPLPNAPPGTVDLHDLLLKREDYQNKHLSISGCLIRSATGGRLECKLRPLQRWQSRHERRAEKILIDMADASDADWRRAFFLCRDDAHTPACGAIVSGVFAESRRGFLHLKDAKVAWTTPPPTAIPPPSQRESYAIEEALIDAVEQSGKVVTVRDCRIERDGLESLRCRGREPSVGFDIALHAPDRSAIARILAHCQERLGTVAETAKPDPRLCQGDVRGVVVRTGGRRFKLEQASIAWKDALPPASSEQEGVYTLDEIGLLKESLDGQAITIARCSLHLSLADHIVCLPADKPSLGASLRIASDLSEEDRARLVDHCAEAVPLRRKPECAARVTGTTRVGPAKPGRNPIRLTDAAVTWATPAPRLTPPASGTGRITVNQLMIDLPRRIGHAVTLSGCSLRMSELLLMTTSCRSAANPHGPSLVLESDKLSQEDIRYLLHTCFETDAEHCHAEVQGTAIRRPSGLVAFAPSAIAWSKKAPLPPMRAEHMDPLDVLLFGEAYAGREITVRNCRIEVDGTTLACVVAPPTGKTSMALAMIDVVLASRADAEAQRLTANCAVDDSDPSICRADVSGTLQMTDDSLTLRDARLFPQRQ